MFWWIFGALVFPALSVVFVVYPRRVEDADWYGNFTESLYLYLFPPGLMLLGWASSIGTLERFGVVMPVWLGAGVGAPLVLLTVLAMLPMMGMPVPGFLTPRWVRERRRREKPEKRRKRQEERQRMRGAREMKAAAVR